jgi:hypothetical protein
MLTTPPPYQEFSPPSINDSKPLFAVVLGIGGVYCLTFLCCLCICLNKLSEIIQNPDHSRNTISAEIVFANNEQNNNDLIALSRDSLTGRVFGGSARRYIPTIIASNTSEPSTHLVRPAPSIPTNDQILTGVVVESPRVNSSTTPR